MLENPDSENKKVVNILTSGYCNNNCIFCCDRSISLGDIKLRSRLDSLCKAPFLTPAAFTNELNGLKKVNSILFTGGEPTLNGDLTYFVRLARKAGCKNIELQTNGRLLVYKSLCVGLIKAGVSRFNVSIQGSSQGIHESLTRSPGAFKQTREGLNNLFALKDKYRFEVSANFTITKLNYGYIYKYLKMILAFKRIDRVIFNTLMYTGNARKFFNQLFVSYTDIAEKVKDAIKKYGRFDGSSSLSIQVSPMPFCLMRGYESYVGMFEEPFQMQNRKIKPLPRSCVHIKNDRCKRCKFYQKCNGVDRFYAQKIGWSEFKPIIK